MADQGAALWDEIRANPDDDGPRLVYADWLAQTGERENEARAQLIHAQLALEAIPRSAAAERAPHEAQVRAVMQRWRRRWLAPLRDIGARWTFRRGFIDGARMSATKFVGHSRRLFEHAPLARTFVFPEASNELVALAQSSDFARVVHADLREMCVCGYCRIENELPHLFASPHAANLETLVLAGCRIDDDNAKRLAQSTSLAGLAMLDVSGNQITVEGARAIAAGLPATRIDLRKNPIAKADAKVLREELGTRIRV